MATYRIFRAGALEAQGTGLDDPLAGAGVDGAVVWLDVTPEELPAVADRLGFHHHAVEDAVKRADVGSEIAQRTKLDRFPGHIFLYLFRSGLDADGQLRLRELPVFARTDLIVTVDRAGALDIAALTERWDAHPELLKHGATALLYGVLDLVVDSHLETVDALADQVDRMEDELFDGDGEEDPTTLARRGFATRKALVRMRRVTAPMRELVSGVMRLEEDDQTPVPPAFTG